MPTAPLLKSGQANAAAGDCIHWENLRNDNQYDWLKVCNAKQFWEAVNERRAALNIAALPVPAAGADGQYGGLADPANTTDKFSVANLQTWLEANGPSFVRSHDDSGNLYPTGYWDGKTSIDNWTIAQLHSISATWLNNLGQSPAKNSTGFTRLRFNGASAVGIADGTEGDYFYHPIWNELYSFTRLLRYTKKDAVADNHSENNHLALVGGAFANWTDAYNDAANSWAGMAPSGAGPVAFALCYGSLSGGLYQCGLERYYEYGEFSGISTVLAHSMECYLLTGLNLLDEARGTYFKHGDDNFRQDVLSLFQSFASAITSTRTTSKIGTVSTPPAKGPAPADLGTPNGAYGYQSRHTGGADTVPVGVLKWSMIYI